MSDFSTIKTQLQKLIDEANTVTGNNDDDLTTAVGNLITGYGVGGTDVDICYVTFMSEDGETELGKKAVIAGDDCMDAVAKGLFPKPTKEPTNTTVYNLSGWSFTIGGVAAADALANVTEDRVVYAAFESAVRYYAVRFFDGDELKNTVQVTYDGTAEYTLEKDGYFFARWEPSNENITADTDCYAQWDAYPTFTDATWEQLATYSESGEAANLFSVGDTKILELSDGGTYTAQLAAFNHDDLADGTGKAGMTILITGVYSTQTQFGMYGGQGWGMTNCYARKLCEDTIFLLLPEELQTHVKQVTKIYRDGNSINSMANNVWIPSITEVNPSSNGSEGAAYPIFTTDETSRITSPEAVDWWLRTLNSSWDNVYVNTSGRFSYTGDKLTKAIRFGFCI